MKKIAVAAFFAVSLNAYSQNLNTSDFGRLELKNAVIDLPLAKAEKSGTVDYSMNVDSNVYFLAQAGKSALFAFIDKQEQYEQFYSFWSKILSDNGFEVVSGEFNNGFAKINYTSKNGLAVRNFWADKMEYNAKDETAIAALKDELTAAIVAKGLKPLAVIRVNNPAFRPTFVIYYAAKTAAAPEKEILLRQLKKGEDIDFELLAGKVEFVKKDSSFSLVYIGRELGFVSKLAVDEKAASSKIEEYKKFLSENKKEFIGFKIKPLEEPFVSGENVFRYLVNFYFFQ